MGVWSRRVALVLAAALGLMVGLPAEVGRWGGGWPVSWLSSWVGSSPAWAGWAFSNVPVQGAFGVVDGDHYVPSAATRADGGSGRRGGSAPGALKPEPSWRAPAADERSTRKAAGEHSFDPSTSVRLADEASAATDVFANADGSRTFRAYAGVANYRGEDGRYHPIDTRLALRPDDRWHMAANSVDVSLARRVPGVGEGPGLAVLTLPSGESVGYWLAGAVGVDAVVAGATATYPEVLAGADLQVSAVSGGVKDVLVLRSAPAVAQWDFPLRLSGLVPRLGEGGSVELVRADGSVAVWLLAGSASDSSVDARSGEPATAAVSYELVEGEGGTVLRVGVDPAWLADPARSYPVHVDPPATISTNGDVYVDNDPATTNQNGDNLPIGTYNGGTTKARSFISFGANFSSAVGGKRIAAANLRLYHTWSYDCNHHLPFYVHKVLSSWSVSGLTNANLSAAPSYTSPIATYTISNNYPACTNSGADRSIGAWVSVPLNVGALNDWSTGGANYGLALTTTETDSFGWKRFTSANFSGGDFKPHLDVTYENNLAPQVDGQYPGYGQAPGTLTPELVAAAHDPDGFPSTLRYQFLVYDSSGSGTPVADSGMVAGRSWVVPAGVLAWGQLYLWTVLVSDGALTSVSQTMNLLSTAVPQPLVTTGLSQNSGQGFAAGVGNYTTSATDAQVATVGPALVVRRFYNSLDPRSAQAFGSGWSSLLDLSAARVLDGSGTVVAVVVTYPSGQQVAFGRNPVDGSFAPPPGRFATLTTLADGYRLVDKDGSTFRFTTDVGGGIFAITSVADAAGRTQTFDYVAGRVATITSASGRALHLSWQTPPGATAAHVATVTTDPATPGDPGSVSTWTYSYSGDALTQVCPPTSSVKCTTYTYEALSGYQTAVRNAGPRSYWRLTETSGPVAGSAVVENAGVDNGSYSGTGVAYGQGSSPLAGSGALAVGFDGSAGRVSLPADLAADARSQSVSLWFKTSGGDGVLLGQTWDDPDTAAGTTGGYVPLLYVGSDGRLVGAFPTSPAVGLLGTMVGYASGRCVNVAGNSAISGASISIYDCVVGASNEVWTLTAAGELRVVTGGATRCMDTFNGNTADGTDVVSVTCNGSLSQKWTVNADGRVVHNPSGRCLDAEGQGVANSTKLQLWACVGGRRGNQSWFPLSHAPLQSATPVADGNWHHAVLVAAGTTQSLYVDDQAAVSVTGVQVADIDPAHSYLGVGYLGGGWPNQSHASTQSNAGVRDYFAGSIAEVAFYDRPLPAATVAALYAANRSVAGLTSVARPSGKVAASVDYDPVTSAVAGVVDANGGQWAPGPVQVRGTGLGYVSAVLAADPVDYWRLAETGTIDAINQVNGEVASYSAVTLGVAGGPFSDASVASFDGTTSYLTLPSTQVPVTGDRAVSLWFKVSAGSTTGGTLYSYQTYPVTGPSSAGVDHVPALYVGTDGKLRGQLWTGAIAPITTATSVNDGNWHHVALSAAGGSQTLYLDGAAAGTLAGNLVGTTAGYTYVGVGETTNWPARPTNSVGYFTGQIADVALFDHALPATAVAAQSGARVGADGLYGKYVTTLDPGGHTSVSVTSVATGRVIADTDVLGNTTSYGYDSAGYLYTVTDPNGNTTTTEHDPRGNTLSVRTCQDRSANLCSTVYYGYTVTDLISSMRDARSADPTDTTYLTSYTYDSMGNRIAVTDALLRVTTTGYTDAATAAVGGGLTPAGLPRVLTTPGGAVQTVGYYASGDVATVTDPAGKVTTFTYDGLGRILTRTEVTDTFPGGLATSYDYDKLGRLRHQSDPWVDNRVTSARHSAYTTIDYDDDGLVVAKTVADLTGGDATRAVSATYNQFGQLYQSTDAAGKTTTFEYNEYGQRVKETGADATVVITEYDSAGQLLTTTLKDYTGNPNDPSPPADLLLSSHAYDPGGRLASVTDAMGAVTSYTYTDNNLVARVTRTDPSTSATHVQQDNGYDGAGNLIRVTTNNLTLSTTYAVDAAGRTYRSTLDPGGVARITTQTLSPDDHVLASVTTSAGVVQSSTNTLYDPLGRVLAHAVATDQFAPLARYRLDEASGQSGADASGNSPVLGAGGVSWSAEHGGSVALDGNWGSALAAAGPVVDTAASFSVSGWVKLAAQPSQNVTAVSQDGVQHSGFYLGYEHSSGAWRFTVCQANQASAGCAVAASAAAAAVGQWVHLAGVYNGQTGAMNLYVNGALAGSATKAAAGTFTAATGPLRLGRAKWAGGAADFWPGGIDDVQLYQQVLTPSQVGQLHAGTAPAAAAAVSRTSYQRDQAGLAYAVTDPFAATTSYSFDEAGRAAVAVAAVVDTETLGGPAVATNPITYTGYDTFGEVTETKDPTGAVTTFGYDAAGRVQTITSPGYTPPGSSTPITAVTTRAYDQLGQLTGVTDPLLRVTNYRYDQLGRLVRITAPDLGRTDYTYDLLGDTLSVTDPTGARAEATYDYLGRTLTSTQIVRQDATNYRTDYTYWPSGLPNATISPAGVTTSTSFNAAGELVTATDGANKSTTYTYDGAGRLTRTTLPDTSYTTISYDLAGRALARQTHRAGDGALLTSTASGYDQAGRIRATTDPNGHTTTYAYNNAGWLTSLIEPVGPADSITTTFGYDAAGRPTRRTDGRGNPFITTYNSWGLPESRIEPATLAYPSLPDRTYTSSYDIAGRLVSQLAPGGVNLNYTYNALDKILTQTGTGAEVPTTTRTFDYDSAGRLTLASAPGTDDTFTYDDRGLLRTTTGASGTATFTYTPDALMASRADAAGVSTYTYDPAGRLSTLTNPTAAMSATLTYNDLSQPTRFDYGSDKRDLTYDDNHRLHIDELTTAAGATVAKITYGYDSNGNLTSKDTIGFAGSASNTYTYDHANRLTTWDNGTTPVVYDYDRSGNRVQAGTRTFTYDERNRLKTSAGPADVVYSYTPRGTMSAVSTLGGSTYHTSADAFGQVITQEHAGGSRTYQYDALGRLLTAGHSYTGQGNTLAADVDTTYVRAPAGELVALTSAGANRLAWTDLHTDVVAQFTPTATTLTGSATYDPYGSATTTTGMLGHLGYQSEYTDTDTGRVNMHARWYTPGTAAFDTRDSVDVPAVPASVAANRYAYADANPLTTTDPTGHCGVCGWVANKASSAVNTVSNAASTAWNATTSVVSNTWNKLTNAVGTTFDEAKEWVKEKTQMVRTAIHNAVDQGRKFVEDKADQARAKVKQKLNQARQAARQVVAAAAKVVTTAAATVADAYQASANWVAEHKDLLIEVAAVGVGILAGIACTAVTAGAGAIACMVGAAALVNLAKDAAQGDIHNLGDAAGSLGTGAWQGALGAVTGGLGGKLAGAALGRLGAAATNIGARAAGGALAGGLSDAATQLATTGSVDLGGVALSAGIGAVFGARTRPGSARPGNRSGADESAAPVDRVTAGPSCRNSFAAGTAVLLADGTRKPIDRIHIGDKVAATDPTTSRRAEAQSVSMLHLNRDHELTDLTITIHRPGHRRAETSVVHTTAHHPLWNATTKTWSDAGDLQPGDQLHTTRPDTIATVVRVRNYTGARNMYNLTVTNIHTYFVLAGNTPVLVHNCGGGSNDRLLSTQASGSGPQLARTMACVCEIANKYGIDISDFEIKINLGGRGYRGMTEPNQQILLTPRAFDNAEQLARTLVHEKFHVGQIRAAGGGYPQTPAQFEAWETAAYAHEDEWWATVGSLIQ